MTPLMITDIRKSCCDRDFDLVTAVFLDNDNHNLDGLRSIDEKCIVILESATAQKESTQIGVRRGDRYIRMKLKINHGLCVGEAITFDAMHKT